MDSAPSGGLLSKLLHTGRSMEIKLNSNVWPPFSPLNRTLGSVASANLIDHQPSGLNGNNRAKPAR